jgi:hypothetical protein
VFNKTEIKNIEMELIVWLLSAVIWTYQIDVSSAIKRSHKPRILLLGHYGF